MFHTGLYDSVIFVDSQDILFELQFCFFIVLISNGQLLYWSHDRSRETAESHADEGEVSDLESSHPDQEELLDVDLELPAEQNYRETMRGVRSFMAWNDTPEFDCFIFSTW